MSNQLCPVQSLIERTINSDSFYSLISKLKERVEQTTRSFGFSSQLSIVSCKSLHCHPSGDASSTLRKHQSHPAGRRSAYMGETTPLALCKETRPPQLLPKTALTHLSPILLSKNLRCCAYSSTRGKVFIAQF